MFKFIICNSFNLHFSLKIVNFCIFYTKTVHVKMKLYIQINISITNNSLGKLQNFILKFVKFLWSHTMFKLFQILMKKIQFIWQCWRCRICPRLNSCLNCRQSLLQNWNHWVFFISIAVATFRFGWFGRRLMRRTWSFTWWTWVFCRICRYINFSVFFSIWFVEVGSRIIRSCGPRLAIWHYPCHIIIMDPFDYVTAPWSGWTLHLAMF